MRHGERGVHRPLAIGCDQDQAACRGRRPRQRRHIERDAGCAHVMREDLAQLIVGDLSDERAFVAECCEPCQRVCRRTARNLARRTHGRIKLHSPCPVDQLHPALGQALTGEKIFTAIGEHIDNGIADRDDVMGGGHKSPFVAG